MYDDGETLVLPGEGLDESAPFYEKAQDVSEALRDSMLDNEMIPEAEEPISDDAVID